MKRNLWTSLLTVAVVTAIVITCVVTFTPKPTIAYSGGTISLKIDYVSTEISVVPDEKQPKDPVLLDRLTDLGIDKSYVELEKDYGVSDGASPYTQTYRDKKSGKYISLTTQLPHVDNYGAPIEAGWIYVGNDLYVIAPNTFTMYLNCDTGHYHMANSEYDAVDYYPELYLDEKLIEPISHALIDDPINPNYLQNTIEIDYGICKRWARSIEGRFKGYWVFDKNPNGNITVKYNQSGKLPLALGQFAIDYDTEYVPLDVFKEPEKYALVDGYPLIIGDDWGPVIASIDGYTYRYADESEWTDILSGAGTSSSDTGTYTYPTWIECETTSGLFERNMRTIVTFDTSTLNGTAPDTGVVSVRYYSVSDGIGIGSTNFTFNLYGCGDPGPSVSNADYQMLYDYTTPMCDTPLTSVTFDSGYEDFILNTAGLNWVEPIGTTNFSFQSVIYDVGRNIPPWSSGGISYMRFYTKDQGDGYEPTLVMTYTPGGEPTSFTEYPASKAFGVIKANYTNWSKGNEPSWPLDDGEAFFYLYNDGTGNCTISVNATNPTGGVGAALVMGTPGSDEVRLSLFAEGDGSTDNITLLDGVSYQFLTNFAPSDNTSFEVKLETGTCSETVPTEKTFHIYFLATAS